jgi:hypothetical protein
MINKSGDYSNGRRLSISTKYTIPGPPPPSEEILSLNGWVMLGVESDQFRLIGKILEDTIWGWHPKQAKMTDWSVTVKYAEPCKAT